ncbi:magnesium transporter CorA family protein [Brevundimonas sp.]|uniref:magnesium transporter CorA family protein n=1 Tax=Brevundimonas sp. TaxID=1871086 RepID=UPI002D7121A6|nr:magnesium transporter CorA family protein [Brevundimonas sp.]HYC68149.1 magnesium transporter CorA family protein [Brevundimonas sp.]
MIRAYSPGREVSEAPAGDPAAWTLPPDAVWIDLVNPTPEEDRAVERALGLSVPTRAEMAELEASSRLYRDNGATYVTADIIQHGDADMPGLEPVTFVLTAGPLITVRYFDPKPFAMLLDKLERNPALCGAGADVFLHLMEQIIDRASDVLSTNAAKVEAVSNHVFSGRKTVGFEKLITQLGRAHIANARIEQSLAGLARIFAFAALDERIERRAEAREHLNSLTRDAQSLTSHNQAVAASIDFQLSAALGLINIEQSSIIKIFSVAAVAFLPPTLIASIYGMNFDHMPELPQVWGYPAALAAMVVSALLPLAWFKRKGWL